MQKTSCHYWVYLLTILVLMGFSSCSRNSQKTDDTNMGNKISPSDDNQVADLKASIVPYKITKMTTPIFIQVYTSFLEAQIIDQRDDTKPSSNSDKNVQSDATEELNQDSQDYLNQQSKEKEEFFSKWGISYNDFNQYSMTHSEEIQDYLKNHTAEQAHISKLEELLSSLQSASTTQNDEYNFKDDSALVEQTTQKESQSKDDKTTVPSPDTSGNSDDGDQDDMKGA